MNQADSHGPLNRGGRSGQPARVRVLLERAEAAATAYLATVALRAPASDRDAARRAWHEASAALSAAVTDYDRQRR
jgi:hypothetical protein